MHGELVHELLHVVLRVLGKVVCKSPRCGLGGARLAVHLDSQIRVRLEDPRDARDRREVGGAHLRVRVVDAPCLRDLGDLAGGCAVKDDVVLLEEGPYACIRLLRLCAAIDVRICRGEVATHHACRPGDPHDNVLHARAQQQRVRIGRKVAAPFEVESVMLLAIELPRRLAAQEHALALVAAAHDALNDARVARRMAHDDAQPGRHAQKVGPVSRLGVRRAEEDIQIARRLLQRHRDLLTRSRERGRRDGEVDALGREPGQGIAQARAAWGLEAEFNLVDGLTAAEGGA